MAVHTAQIVASWSPAWSGKRIGRVHATRLTRTNTQRVFGETQTNASLDAVGQLVAIQLIECLAGHSNFVKLHETHWSILFVSETQSLVSALLGEQSLELLLGCVWREITDVECVAWRVEVVRVCSW